MFKRLREIFSNLVKCVSIQDGHNNLSSQIQNEKKDVVIIIIDNKKNLLHVEKNLDKYIKYTKLIVDLKSNKNNEVPLFKHLKEEENFEKKNDDEMSLSSYNSSTSKLNYVEEDDSKNEHKLDITYRKEEIKEEIKEKEEQKEEQKEECVIITDKKYKNTIKINQALISNEHESNILP